MAYTGLTSCDTKKQIAGVQTCAKAPEPAVPSRDVRMMVPELPRMRRFALLLARDHDWADDLVQESLARAIRHFDTWEPGTNLRTWLMAILRNVFFNELRRVRRTGEPVTFDDTLHVRVHAEAQPLEVDLAAVQRAFGRLSDVHREILHLVALEEFSYVEAASVLGLPVGTVRSRLSRARAAMRGRLGDTQKPNREIDRSCHSAASVSPSAGTMGQPADANKCTPREP